MPAILDVYDEYVAKAGLIDEKLARVLRYELKENLYKEDDTLFLIGGRTNSGKSNIAHDLHDAYTSGRPDIQKVAFDKPTIAKVIKHSLSLPEVQLRVSHYDEANVSKREGMSSFNRRLIDLYESIRGKRGFHIWCTPSFEYMERKFLEERINCLIYCFKKPKGKYILIPKKNIRRMIDQYGDLYQDTIEAHGWEFALIKNGRFKKYPDNEFKKQYLAMKDNREDFKIDEFYEDFGEGEDLANTRQICKMIRVSEPTIKKYVAMMIAEKILDEDKIKSPTGVSKFTMEQVAQIKDYISTHSQGSKPGPRLKLDNPEAAP